MILGHIASFERDAASLPPEIVRGVTFLIDTDISALPAGRHDIDGDRIFALISDYTTEEKARKRPESHVRHIDIQFVARGRETIGYTPLARAGAVTEDLLATKDVQFFGTVAGETDLLIEAGDYAVFYPSDVHRPGCVNGAATAVRKVVIKIRA